MLELRHLERKDFGIRIVYYLKINDNSAKVSLFQVTHTASSEPRLEYWVEKRMHYSEDIIQSILKDFELLKSRKQKGWYNILK